MDTEVNKDVRQSNQERVVIHGIVTPCDWDKEGNIIGLALSTQNEEEYLIEDDAKGKELLKDLHQQVRIGGRIMETSGTKIIKVEEYELEPIPHRETEIWESA